MFDLSMGDVKSLEDIQRRFHAIAIELMSKYDIKLNHLPEHRLRISSLELYLYKKDIWEDPTTHAQKIGINNQLTSGRWYVHRYKKDGKFRPPRRRGIDITAGSESYGVHAGLLIRGVNGIDGPALATNSFLFGNMPKSTRRNWSYSLREEDLFHQIDDKSIDSDLVSVVEASTPRSCDFYIGRRVGLSKSKVNEKYLNSILRIAAHPGVDLKKL